MLPRKPGRTRSLQKRRPCRRAHTTAKKGTRRTATHTHPRKQAHTRPPGQTARTHGGRDRPRATHLARTDPTGCTHRQGKGTARTRPDAPRAHPTHTAPREKDAHSTHRSPTGRAEPAVRRRVIVTHTPGRAGSHLDAQRAARLCPRGVASGPGAAVGRAFSPEDAVARRAGGEYSSSIRQASPGFAGTDLRAQRAARNEAGHTGYGWAKALCSQPLPVLSKPRVRRPRGHRNRSRRASP
jgi:hypothetical protein